MAVSRKKKAPRWKVAVQVTTGGIKLGVKKETGSCPIARALKYLKFQKVSVSAYEVYFSYKGVVYDAPLPAAARRFISRFDEGKTVKPLTFNIYPEARD